VERSGSDIAIAVVNAAIEPLGNCGVEKLTAGRMMCTPERARLEILESAGLAYVPFPEIELLRFGEQLFNFWPTRFSEGVILLEDHPRGEKDQPNSELRFVNCHRLRFEDGWALKNAGFLGRFLVWIDYPCVFMNISFSEFSGLCCPPEHIESIFGQPLETLVKQFAEYAEKILEEDDRSFYLGLTDHYSKQWLLK
jgi:hypothetical protein